MAWNGQVPVGERLAMVKDAIEYGAATLREAGTAAGCTGEYVRQLLNRLDDGERKLWLARMVENRERGTLQAFGVTKTYVQWVRDPRCGAGVLTTTLGSRVENGWDPEEAVTTPRVDCGDVRPSLRPPDRLPVEVASHLAELCRTATRVRGWTSADDPGRAAARERDRLVRKLSDEGYTISVIAASIGYSTHAVQTWLRYTSKTAPLVRYEMARDKTVA
jgi:hypothetical protein